jgi:hypothetical protein
MTHQIPTCRTTPTSPDPAVLIDRAEPGAQPAESIPRVASRAPAAGHVAVTLVLISVVAGASLAVLGFLMATDRLSLRALLAGTGPASVWQMTLAIHAEIQHSGAQAAEIASGLLGLVIIAMSIRGLRRLVS